MQHGALMPAIGGVPIASGTMATMNFNTRIRLPESVRLTREAMEQYLRDRNDKVVVILHAKVNMRSHIYTRRN